MLKRLLVNAANLKKFTEFTAQILQFIREYLKGNYQIFSDPRTSKNFRTRVGEPCMRGCATSVCEAEYLKPESRKGKGLQGRHADNEMTTVSCREMAIRENAGQKLPSADSGLFPARLSDRLHSCA